MIYVIDIQYLTLDDKYITILHCYGLSSTMIRPLSVSIIIMITVSTDLCVFMKIVFNTRFKLQTMSPTIFYSQLLFSPTKNCGQHLALKMFPCNLLLQNLNKNNVSYYLRKDKFSKLQHKQFVVLTIALPLYVRLVIFTHNPKYIIMLMLVQCIKTNNQKYM